MSYCRAMHCLPDPSLHIIQQDQIAPLHRQHLQFFAFHACYAASLTALCRWMLHTLIEGLLVQTGCCKFDGLSSTGLIAIILLLFIFWPVAFIPCLMPECYEPYQRPVYA